MKAGALRLHCSRETLITRFATQTETKTQAIGCGFRAFFRGVLRFIVCLLRCDRLASHGKKRGRERQKGKRETFREQVSEGKRGGLEEEEEDLKKT